MSKRLMKGLNVLISIVLVGQLAGCGTIMYPERKGQKSGRLDSGVVILDAIGLLFFFIPGVIAFAVDFNNGTIYLPGSSRASLDKENIKQVKFDPKHTSLSQIEKIIKYKTGRSIQLTQSNMRVSRLDSREDMMTHFAQALPDINRLAYVYLTEESHD